LQGSPSPLPQRHGRSRPAAPRHAHGWSPRGHLARHHPQEPRCHPLHRWSRPRWPRQEQGRQGLVRRLRCADCRAEVPGGARHQDGRVPGDDLHPRPRRVPARQRDRPRYPHCQHFWHGAPQPPQDRQGDSRMV
ncbi:hypothetical protein BN1723_019954, partial [Verticillium longisporum]